MTKRTVVASSGRSTVAKAERGELPQRYKEGQEDQLSALGLVVNAIVLWNTRYIEAALGQVRAAARVSFGDDARVVETDLSGPRKVLDRGPVVLGPIHPQTCRPGLAGENFPGLQSSTSRCLLLRTASADSSRVVVVATGREVSQSAS